MVNGDYSWVYRVYRLQSVGWCVCTTCFVCCVLCVGVVNDTVAQIYLQVSLKLILPAAAGGGQEAATHLDSSGAAGLCIVSMLYAAVFCSIPSRWPRWRWLECRQWAHLIINTSSQTDASRHNTTNASEGRLSQEGASFIAVTPKENMPLHQEWFRISQHL